MTAIWIFLKEVIEKYIVESLRGIGSIDRRGRISILLPHAGDIMVKSGMLGGNPKYLVRGHLGFLPKDHEIWLFVEDQTDKRPWPQGFEAVQFDPMNGAWSGFVTDVPLKNSARVAAAVAPPTSCDFFRYYQLHGSKTNWAPLARLPPECANVQFVQVKVPA